MEKSNGEYENYKKKRAEQRRFSGKKANDLMTAAEKEQSKVKRKLEQRLHKQRNKDRQIIQLLLSLVLHSNLKHLKGRMYNEFPKCYLRVSENKKQLLKN